MNSKTYILPKLPYSYSDLEPLMSAEQLRTHHQKHHKAYIDKANILLEDIDAARKENSDIDIGAILKELSFNIGGHILHTLFWNNLIPPKARVDRIPAGALADSIKKEFGNFERFKEEFTEAALRVEGSGWAALVFHKEINRLLIMQIEKHNVNIIPSLQPILVLDVWEHAYYIDYKNARGNYADAFWDLVDWMAVGRRFELAVM